MGTTAAIVIKLSGVLSLVSVTWAASDFVGGVRLRGRRQTSWAASDFVLGSYELFSKPKTKSDTAKPTDFVAVTFTPPHLRPRS